MNKIRTFFAAFILAVCLVVVTPQSAQATWVNVNVTSTHEGVSLTVFYERDSDNTGFKLNAVEISGCDGTCTGVDGYSLKCMNQDGTVKWSKPSDQINLGHADGKSWAPGQLWSGATELKCVYDGLQTKFPDWNGGNPFTDIVDRT